MLHFDVVHLRDGKHFHSTFNEQFHSNCISMGTERQQSVELYRLYGHVFRSGEQQYYEKCSSNVRCVCCFSTDCKISSFFFERVAYAF